mgnify:CR=1 FL=1
MRRLTDEAIVEVLTRNGVGVLALGATGDGYPYPLPVAFGYDPAIDCLALQLEGDRQSEKFRHLRQSERVGFTVYERSEEGSVWRSVVVRGRLDETAYEEIEPAFAALTENTRFAPSPLSWGDSAAVTPFALAVDDWSGREFHVG